jgi:hypothetical protein
MVDPDEFTILKQDNAKLRTENVALQQQLTRYFCLSENATITTGKTACTSTMRSV